MQTAIFCFNSVVCSMFYSNLLYFPVHTTHDAIITMSVVAVLVHIVSSAWEVKLAAGHFQSIAAGASLLAGALDIALLLIIPVPRIWWLLLSAWVVLFIWVAYTLREELLQLRESLCNAVRQAKEQNAESSELPV
jgi:hypothetical protein